MTNENISVTEVQNENSVIAERRAKLLKLREHGVAYPNDFVRKDLFGDLNEKYGNKTAEELAAIADTSARALRPLSAQNRLSRCCPIPPREAQSILW